MWSRHHEDGEIRLGTVALLDCVLYMGMCCVQDLKVECVAIINDNVGVLMAGAHSDLDCKVGLIVGKHHSVITK